MAVRAVKGTLFSTVAQERDIVVRPRGGGVGGESRVHGGLGELGPCPGPRKEKGPTCDDVLNGTILPLVHGPVLLGLAPPQLCN